MFGEVAPRLSVVTWLALPVLVITTVVGLTAMAVQPAPVITFAPLFGVAGGISLGLGWDVRWGSTPLRRSLGLSYGPTVGLSGWALDGLVIPHGIAITLGVVAAPALLVICLMVPGLDNRPDRGDV